MSQLCCRVCVTPQHPTSSKGTLIKNGSTAGLVEGQQKSSQFGSNACHATKSYAPRQCDSCFVSNVQLRVPICTTFCLWELTAWRLSVEWIRPTNYLILRVFKDTHLEYFCEVTEFAAESAWGSPRAPQLLLGIWRVRRMLSRFSDLSEVEEQSMSECFSPIQSHF